MSPLKPYVLYFLLPVTFCFPGYLLSSRKQETPVSNVDKAQWMSQIWSHIGSKRLSEIVFPGSHDSATSGTNEDFILVRRTELFELAQDLTPGVLVNWSKTQPDNLWNQLMTGYRYFDLRIADVEEEDFGNFRWWHSITADVIYEGLEQIRRFASTYPNEILLLDFGHFAKPGNSTDFPILPIPNRRKDELTDILLFALEDHLVPYLVVGPNPTFDQVRATNRNVIAIIRDDYIQGKHPNFWPGSVKQTAWAGRTNTEDLFLQRSDLLRYFHENHNGMMTESSTCITADERMIIAGLIRRFGDDPDVIGIIEIILPELLGVDPDTMSFEGMWVDLLTMANLGANTNGMWTRSPQHFTNGGSVHYVGSNYMMRYWLSRPALYRMNIHSIDDTPSSQLVDLAIQANQGLIPREVAITFQGNSMDGFYEWDGLVARRGTEGYNCTTGVARYKVTSQGTDVVTWTDFPQKTDLVFQEGQFPADAQVWLEVGSDGENWHAIYNGVIQSMIQSNYDIYMRSSVEENNTGLAYLSQQYNLFGENCTLPAGAEHSVRW